MTVLNACNAKLNFEPITTFEELPRATQKRVEAGDIDLDEAIDRRNAQMERALLQEAMAEAAPRDDVAGYGTIRSHMNQWMTILEESFMSHVLGDRRTYVRRSMGFALMFSAAKNFTRTLQTASEGTSWYNDGIYRARVVRDFGMSCYDQDTEAGQKALENGATWICDRLAPLDREIDPVELAKILEIDTELARKRIEHEQTFIKDTLRGALEGFLDGARYDDVQQPVAGEFDETTARYAATSAANAIRNKVLKDITWIKEKRVTALLQGRGGKYAMQLEADQKQLEMSLEFIEAAFKQHELDMYE